MKKFKYTCRLTGKVFDTPAGALDSISNLMKWLASDLIRVQDALKEDPVTKFLTGSDMAELLKALRERA